MDEAELLSKLKKYKNKRIDDIATLLKMPRTSVVRLLKKYNLYKGSPYRKSTIVWTQEKIDELTTYENDEVYVNLTSADKARLLGVTLPAYYAAKSVYIKPFKDIK